MITTNQWCYWVKTEPKLRTTLHVILPLIQSYFYGFTSHCWFSFIPSFQTPPSPPINSFPRLFCHFKLTSPHHATHPHQASASFLTLYIFCRLITNMGRGNNKQKKSSSFFCCFKPRRSRTYDEHGFEDGMSARNKNFRSDEGGVPCIPDPLIDIKAPDYIARFHAT